MVVLNQATYGLSVEVCFCEELCTNHLHQSKVVVRSRHIDRRFVQLLDVGMKSMLTKKVYY